ncbi:hypothetical protein D3C81_1075490 [compost metagenome]
MHTGKGRQAEQGQVQHGPRRAPLHADENGQQQGRATEQSQAGGAAPATIGRLQQAIGKQGECSRKRQGAGPVDTLRLRVARFAHGPRGGQQGGQASRGRGRKNGAPARVGDERAREEGAEGQAHAEGRADQAEGARTGGAVEFLRQRCQSARQGHGAPQALDGAQHVEPHNAGRGRQCQRGGGKHGHAQQEHALAAIAVGQRAGHHQAAAKAEHEGIRDPGQRQRRAVQVGGDGGNGDGRPRKAERHAQRGQTDGCQHQRTPCSRWFRGLRGKSRIHGNDSRNRESDDNMDVIREKVAENPLITDKYSPIEMARSHG